MAVYKVIQDIESEDKIVGFLTLKTFIYALIAGALIYINIRFLMANVLGPTRFAIVFLLFWPMLLFGVLAAPLGGEQSTEVWILARVRFYLKPRIRVWNQSGLLELVTVTAPKKIERQLTKDLTQTEVRSRLKALATTMDSRGWAVRNVAVNLTANPSYLDIVEPDSDRLTAGSNLPQTKTATDINASDDIMDAQHNPTAQHFEALMQQEDEKRKKQVSEKIAKQVEQQKNQPEQPQPQVDYSFLDKVDQKEEKKQKGNTSFVAHEIVAPGSESKSTKSTDVIDPALAAAEQEFIEKDRKLSAEIHARSAGFMPKQHENKEIVADTPQIEQQSEAQTNQQPTIEQPQPTQPEKAPQQTPAPVAAQVSEQPKEDQSAMTNAAQNANLKELAQSGNELTVASVQKLANRNSENIKQIGPNEVEIDFHSH